MIRKGYVDTDIASEYVNKYYEKIKKTVNTVERDRLLDVILRQDHEIEYLKELLEEERKDKKYYESMYKAMRELVDRKGF